METLDGGTKTFNPWGVGSTNFKEEGLRVRRSNSDNTHYKRKKVEKNEQMPLLRRSCIDW